MSMRTTGIRWLATWGLLLAVPAGASRTATVQGGRVNLRARPDLHSEVVGQVSEGERLQVRSHDEEWVEVAVPSFVNLWVHRDFVLDGRVQSRRLNVRSGPGINFNVVGMLELNEAVDVRETVGEWLGIAPPSSCSVWVSVGYVDLETPAARPERRTPPPTPPAPVPPERRETVSPPRPVAPPPAPPDAVPPRPAPAPIRPAPSPAAPSVSPAPFRDLPAHWRLIPLEGQGRPVEREGILRRAGFVLNRPARFRLLREEGPGYVTLCYIHGNEAQLKSFLGRTLRVEGREYWVRDTRFPVVAVERIRPAPERPSAP